MFALNLTWRHDVFDGKKCEEGYGEDNGAEMKTDLQPMCAFPVVLCTHLKAKRFRGAKIRAV